MGSEQADHSDRPADTARAEVLLAALPSFAQAEFRRDASWDGDPPQTTAALFARLRSWNVGAGIAEGRGGYPGGRAAPDWTDYVALQRRHLAVYDALVTAFGEPDGATARYFAAVRESTPPDRRRMGEGYEPHVDEVAGRLVYATLVWSGTVSIEFRFPFRERDLAVLLADPWRRAVLEAVSDHLLKRSMVRGSPEVTELDFGRLVNAVLHCEPAELERWLDCFDREHRASATAFARAAMARRSAQVHEDEPPSCAS